jgi:hypothetical protein
LHDVPLPQRNVMQREATEDGGMAEA